MAQPAGRPSLLKYLYNHNPFYAISTVLMLYALWKSYAAVGAGVSGVWLMAGGLAGYALVLASIGIGIVRAGKVWEDARSILLLLVLLFLAISIGMDDLFVQVDTSRTATWLLVGGFLFAAAVSEAVLWSTRVRLGAWYRVPYHLMLALFFVAPWFYSPALHPRPETENHWLLLLFPLAAGALFLLLLPAVRGGKAYVANNGTPWPWPWYPTPLYVFIAVAVSLRSFALTMTFGFDGPIWRSLPSGRAISFDTPWGLYFLIPLALVLLILSHEAAIVAGSKRVQRNVMLAAAGLLLLGYGIAEGPVATRFLHEFVSQVGSPLWLAAWLLVGFYSWAWLRGIAGAGFATIASLISLSIVGPRSIDVASFTRLQEWPFLLACVLLIARSLWTQTTGVGLVGVLLGVEGLVVLVPQTPLAQFTYPIALHFLWLGSLALGLIHDDRLARWVRSSCAWVFAIVGFVVLNETQLLDLSGNLRAVYVAALAAACLAIALLWRNIGYLYAAGGVGVAVMYAGSVGLYQQVMARLGHDATTAFAWSLGALTIGVLISAQKANLIPGSMFRWWRRIKPQENRPTRFGTANRESPS